jgi:hypothetical protein
MRQVGRTLTTADDGLLRAHRLGGQLKTGH